MVVILTALRAVPAEVYESARLDGASEWQIALHIKTPLVMPAVIEVARTDGAGELRIFLTVALPMMLPGLVTVFLFQFVAIWNNFLLPYIMLGDDRKFPAW
jgi:ABC-type glycerol-3-phosphate transport system permease component